MVATRRGRKPVATWMQGRRRSVARRLTAEFVGTAFLVATIVGSGIAGDRLSDSTGLALAINAIAVGGVLVALILAFGPASGAHFNPVVSLAQAALGGMRWPEVPAYVAVQCIGGILGAVAGNLMFEESAIAISDTDRLSAGLVFAEVVATFGLLAVIFGCARARRPATSVAFAVGPKSQRRSSLQPQRRLRILPSRSAASSPRRSRVSIRSRLLPSLPRSSSEPPSAQACSGTSTQTCPKPPSARQFPATS
jgi:hypothetical protein